MDQLASVFPRYIYFSNSNYVNVWWGTASVVIVEYLATGNCNACAIGIWDFCFLDNSHISKNRLRALLNYDWKIELKKILHNESYWNIMRVPFKQFHLGWSVETTCNTVDFQRTIYKMVSGKCLINLEANYLESRNICKVRFLKDFSITCTTEFLFLK